MHSSLLSANDWPLCPIYRRETRKQGCPRLLISLRFPLSVSLSLLLLLFGALCPPKLCSFSCPTASFQCLQPPFPWLPLHCLPKIENNFLRVCCSLHFYLVSLISFKKNLFHWFFSITFHLLVFHKSHQWQPSCQIKKIPSVLNCWTLYSISHHSPLPHWNVLFTWLLQVSGFSSYLSATQAELPLDTPGNFLWSLLFRSWVGRRKSSCSCFPAALLLSLYFSLFSLACFSPWTQFSSCQAWLWAVPGG